MRRPHRKFTISTLLLIVDRISPQFQHSHAFCEESTILTEYADF